MPENAADMWTRLIDHIVKKGDEPIQWDKVLTLKVSHLRVCQAAMECAIAQNKWELVPAIRAEIASTQDHVLMCWNKVYNAGPEPDLSVGPTWVPEKVEPLAPPIPAPSNGSSLPPEQATPTEE